MNKVQRKQRQLMLNARAKKIEDDLRNDPELTPLLESEEAPVCILFIRKGGDQFTALEWDTIFSIPWSDPHRQILELLREEQPRPEKELSAITGRHVNYQMRDAMNAQLRFHRFPFSLTTSSRYRSAKPGWLMVRKFRK
jgi:hypothetical protein